MPKPTELMKTTTPTNAKQSYGELLQSVKNTQTNVDTLKSALQGELPKESVTQTKPVESKTTQQAVATETGVQGTTKGNNEALAAQYSRRDEWAGEPTRPAQTISSNAAKSAIENDKSDSTVRNTVLSYYSKRQFEEPVTASTPLSEVKPTRVDNTIMGTAQNYAGTIGGGLTSTNKFVADRLYDNNNNVTNPGLTDYARQYYSDKDDQYLRDNLSPAVYKAVTNAMKTNADMRQQALEQRNATDALQAAGRAKLESAKEGTGKLGSLAVGVGENIMEMTADRAIGAALSYLGIPQKVSQYAPLYLRSLGGSDYSARTEMEDKLASQIASGVVNAKDADAIRAQNENKAFLYGNLAAGLELATETALSPTNFAEATYGKGWLNIGDGKKMLSTLSHKLAKSELGQSLVYMAGTLGLAGGEEALEEAVSGIFEPVIKRMTYDKDAKFDAKETAESMLTAFLATVVTGGAGVAQTNANAKVYNNPTTVNSLINIAQETSDANSKARKFADNLSSVVENGGKPTNTEVVDLIHYLNDSGSEAQNNKLYELADVDKNAVTAKAQLHSAITMAMQEASDVINEVVNDKGKASTAAQRNFDNNVGILANALVSEDVADILKPTIAYTLQQANEVRTATEATPVGIRRGDTVSYHVSQAANETAPEGITGYDVVRRHDDGSVDYITVDDFNGNQYPVITRQVTVDKDGNITDTTPQNATIINDKSTLVAPTYTGFDIEAQKQAEDYWKSGRRRTNIPYNATQMNNKAYFDNYLRMLQEADRIRAVNNQEVSDNGRTESISDNGGRNNAVDADQQGSGVSENAYIAEKSNELYTIKSRYGTKGKVGKRIGQVTTLMNALRSSNAQSQTCAEFAGDVGGVESATVIPITGKLASRFSKLTNKIHKAGIRNVKYYAGDLVVEYNTDRFIVNGANNEESSTIYVCVDNLLYTPEEIAEHEVFHTILNKNPGMQDDLVAQLETMEGFDDLYEKYWQKYEGTGENEQGILTEMLCDAYSGMNIFIGTEHVVDGKAVAESGAEVYQQAVRNFAENYTPNENATRTVENTAPQATTETETAPAEAEEITEPTVETEETEEAEPEETTEEDVETEEPEEETTEEDVNNERASNSGVDRQTNEVIDRLASMDANQEIWAESNAKFAFPEGGEKNPSKYKVEVVETFPNGTVRHAFFNTMDDAEEYAERRNNRNRTGAAIVVDLTIEGNLEASMAESTMANEYGGEYKKTPKYSRDLTENEAETLDNVDVGYDEENKLAYRNDLVNYSVATLNESRYVKERDASAKILAKNLKVTVEQAKKYIDDINSIAAMIANDPTRLDYEAAEGVSSYMGNAEYIRTIDFSTICTKRRLYSGTFSAIQKALPNTVFTADDLMALRNAMVDAGLQSPCVMCFVESSRINMGTHAAEFIKQFKANNPDAEWIPDMYDVNTPEGAEAMRNEHPDVYDQYNYFWNTQGRLEGYEHWKETGKKPKSFETKGLFSSQGKAKLFQASTAYDGEITKYYGGDHQADLNIIKKAKKNGTMDSAEAKEAQRRIDFVEKTNLFGGIRQQSFSDFEIIHLLDAMQVAMDLSAAGLKSHAYTKVPEFAKAFGNSGIKINLSLVAKGVGEDGRLIFNDVEGMPWETAKELREKYPQNVGDIVVTFNDKQLRAAMADDRIDFIIPFHRSQWTKKQFNKMGLGTDSKDFAPYQKERWLDSSKHIKTDEDGNVVLNKDGKPTKKKITQIPPMAYWDYTKSGKENAERYLELCANGGTVNGYEVEGGRRPKFYKLLTRNPDGSFSLPADGSADGYWKLLIDFKMYDNEGKGAPFEVVKPVYNMDEAKAMLDSYEGGHDKLPVAQEFADKYIEDYKRDHPNQKYSRSFTSAEEMDSAYNEAVASGDEDRARKIMNEFAEAKGYIPKPLYHGTASYGFTEFDLRKMDDHRSIFMTDIPDVARSYSGSDYVGTPDPGKVYRLSTKELVDTYNKENKEQHIHSAAKKFSHVDLVGMRNYLISDTRANYARLAVKYNAEIKDAVNKYGELTSAEKQKDEDVKNVFELLKSANGYEDFVYAQETFNDLVFGTPDENGFYDDSEYKKVADVIYSGTDYPAKIMDNDKIAQLGQLERVMNEDEAVMIAEDGMFYYVPVDEFRGYVFDSIRTRDKGNLMLYARPGNPLVVDANGANWNSITFDPTDILGRKARLAREYNRRHKYDETLRLASFDIDKYIREGETPPALLMAMEEDSNLKAEVEGLKEEELKFAERYGFVPSVRTRTRQVSKYAFDNGYDSVIFKNIIDSGPRFPAHNQSTIYILFDPQNVKSADTITYDSDGEIIPLSQRFDDTNNDIRYSRAFDTPTQTRATAENEYIKTMVGDFNSSTASQNKFRGVNPTKVAETIKNKYGSTIDTTKLQEAVNELKQYGVDALNEGRNIDYADAKAIAITVARNVALQSSALTNNEGYKTYAKMIKFIDSVKIAPPSGVSRYISNYQGWKTDNIDNIHIDTTGAMKVTDAYKVMQANYGKVLFPDGLKQYEMLKQIAEVVGNYRAIYENPYNVDMDIASQYVSNDLMNSMFVSPGTIDLGAVDLSSVYDKINTRREKLLDAVGRAYEDGESLTVASMEAYKKAQTIEDVTDTGVSFRHANLPKSEWTTEETKNNKAPVESPTDIIARMEAHFGFNITEGQIRMHSVLGVFYRNDKGIRIKNDNDIATASHELGHALDEKYQIINGLNDTMKNELMNNHSAEVIDNIKSSYPQSAWLGETIAEYNREFFKNKDNAQNKFPEFTKYYLNAMDEDTRAHMIAMADIINKYYVRASKSAEMSQRLRSEKLKDYVSWEEKLQRKGDRFYQMWIDTNRAIQRFSEKTGSDAYVLATNSAYSDARAGQILVGQLFDKDGLYAGEGLTSALNDIDLKDNKEYKAFGEYLIVKHGPEFKRETGGDVFANPIQNSEEWMEKRAKELEEQYPQFKKSAEKLYKFQQEFLWLYGVETGLISEDTFDYWTQNYVIKESGKRVPVKVEDGEVLDLNGKPYKMEEGDELHRARWDYYVPFNRVLQDETGVGYRMGGDAKRGFANQTNVIKSAHGSTKDIYHPVDNIMVNVIKLVKAGINNQVMLEIADTATQFNVDARVMSKVPAPQVRQSFYTDELKKKLKRQFETANAQKEIADESMDAITDIVEGIDSVIDQYRVGKATGKVIALMRNGTEEYWEINDAFLLESLTRMNSERAGALLEAYSVVSKFMTSNITGNNLLWSLGRNAPKDLGTAINYSPTKNPIRLFGGIASAYKNSLMNSVGLEVDPFYQEYLAMGGGKTSAYTAEIDTADKMRKQMRVKSQTQKAHHPTLASFCKTPIEAIELVSDTVELGPRYATYRALRLNGETPQKAFYEACDVTVNFRRGGWMARQVNKATPFFNANVQGIDKFIRYFTAVGVPKSEKTKVLAGRAAFFVAESALMAAMTMALNYRDKKKEKEYEQLSSFTKNSYWCIPSDIANRFPGVALKQGEFVALPKPRELGVLSSFIERCFESYMGDNAHAFDEFATYMSDNLLPAYLKDLADAAFSKDKNIVEGFETWPTNVGILGVFAYMNANQDFLGRPIVSETLLKYEKQDQFTGRTSIPAYYIGQAFNLSPQKIDFFGNQVFSNVWKPMQSLFPKDDFYKDKWVGLKNTWVKDSQYSNDLTNWMYDEADRAERAHNSDKENISKSIQYNMDNKMKSFYGNYYSLTKELDETADSRLYRQKVLDMIYDYREALENGIPASQKPIIDVIKKAENTKLLPSVMGTTIKDANDNEIELDYKQYYNYQGLYNDYYYDLAREAFTHLTSQDDRAAALDKILGNGENMPAKILATDDMLVSMGKEKTGKLDKFKDVNMSDVIVWRVLCDNADAAGVSVDDDGNVKNNGNIDQKEARYALDQMDWLTPHEKAVIWNSKWETVKNNPWKDYL